MRVGRHIFIGIALISAGCNQKTTNDAQGNAASSADMESTNADAIAAQLAAGNLSQAAEMARSASQANPSDPQLLLLLARAEARLNNNGNAIAALDKSFAAGFHDPRGAANHPDFDKLRRTSEFQSFMKKWGISASAASANRSSNRPTGSVTSAGDVSITEGPGGTTIRAGDVTIED